MKNIKYSIKQISIGQFYDLYIKGKLQFTLEEDLVAQAIPNEIQHSYCNSILDKRFKTIYGTKQEGVYYIIEGQCFLYAVFDFIKNHEDSIFYDNIVNSILTLNIALDMDYNSLSSALFEKAN